MVDTLSAFIRAKEDAGSIHGCSISHLFFVDDCFVYFIANTDEAREIKQILTEYGTALGQKINFQKSSVSFSCNVDEVCSSLNVCSTSEHGTYLGIPSMVGRGKRKAIEFLKDRVWHRINN